MEAGARVTTDEEIVIVIVLVSLTFVQTGRQTDCYSNSISSS